MNVNNCRIHEHLASSGKVKTQQDSKSCCFRNSGLPGGAGRGKDAAAAWTPVFIKARWIRRLLGSTKSPPHTASSSVSWMSTALHQRELCVKLIFNSVISGCLFSPPPPHHHWLVSMLFHYQICFRIPPPPPVPPLLNVVNFKVNIVLLSLALRSRWANGSSLLAVRKKARERETVGESVCAAARWCAEYRTDLRPQATGRGLLYTPGTSLKPAAEEAHCHWAASTADT